MIQNSICPIDDCFVEMLEARRDSYCGLQRPESPGLRGRKDEGGTQRRHERNKDMYDKSAIAERL